jgi:thiol-disulfide isomerase/thioredoxin
MSKTIIKTFFILLFASLLMLLLATSFTSKIYYNTIFSFTGYFFFTLFSLKFFSKKLSAFTIMKIIFATILVLQSFTIYTWFVWDTYGLPVVFACCLSVVSAYSFFRSKPPQNLILLSLSVCFVAFMFFWGWDYWLHRINFGTFTGKVEAYYLPVKFEAFDERKNLITDADLQNKIVLLDFWHTRCGICFVKFPQLEAVYNKYKNDSSVVILAVDKPIEEDKPDEAFQIIKDEGYTFPVVISKDEEMPEKFGVKWYPTTFVINQNGQIIYKGGIEGAVKMVDLLSRQ